MEQVVGLLCIVVFFLVFAMVWVCSDIVKVEKALKKAREEGDTHYHRLKKYTESSVDRTEKWFKKSLEELESRFEDKLDKQTIKPLVKHIRRLCLDKYKTFQLRSGTKVYYAEGAAGDRAKKQEAARKVKKKAKKKA